MNNNMASYFLKAQLHAQALDDDQHLLESSISMLSFLPPPISNTSNEQAQWLKSHQLEETEQLVGEHADKKTRINTKAFVSGLQSEPTHIITAVSNFDAMGCLAVDFDEYDEVTLPLMMRQFRELADLYSSHKGNKYMLKYKATTPHLPHILLV